MGARSLPTGSFWWLWLILWMMLCVMLLLLMVGVMLLLLWVSLSRPMFRLLWVMLLLLMGMFCRSRQWRRPARRSWLPMMLLRGSSQRLFDRNCPRR